MKRLLFVHHTSSIGGASYCMLNIIKSLDKSNFEVFVALKNHGPLSDELEKLGIKVIFLPQLTELMFTGSVLKRRYLSHYFSYLRSLKAFKCMLKDWFIDIVYLNSMALIGYLRPSKDAGCKTILHVREHMPIDTHKLRLYWYRAMVNNFCDRLIAINNYSASIFPQKKSVIVYDWIDMKSRYKEIRIDDLIGEDISNKKIILFTGGRDPIKGADYVAKAFVNHIKGDEYRLLMLGIPNYSQIISRKEKLKDLLERVGVKFYDRELKKLILSDFRIKCSPAVYEISSIIEQSYCFVSYFRKPHANLAMAENIILNKPCIAADNDEAREYTNNGKYAMLVPPNNIKVFADSLCDFINNIHFWTDAAIKGAESISFMFDKERNIKQLHKVLLDIID